MDDELVPDLSSDDADAVAVAQMEAIVARQYTITMTTVAAEARSNDADLAGRARIRAGKLAAERRPVIARIEARLAALEERGRSDVAIGLHPEYAAAASDLGVALIDLRYAVAAVSEVA